MNRLECSPPHSGDGRRCAAGTAARVLPFRPAHPWRYTRRVASKEGGEAEVPTAVSFRLGEWLVEPSLNRLTSGERVAHLEPRAMDLLVYLAERAGKVVGREELLDAVWQRQFVADATLSHAVAKLRRALGDDPQGARFVETIPKRGYRLVATVETPAPAGGCEGESPQLVTRGVEPRSSALPGLAVLPFVDMSPGGDHEYFGDGVAEEITNALACLTGLRVAARTSAFAFKGARQDVREIGQQLGVDAVLEGSVRKASGRLRVTAQLISVADGMHLWSERFEASDEDVFAVQDAIAEGVVRRMHVPPAAGLGELFGRRGSPSRGAYDLYLRGRHLLNRRRREELQRALEYLEQAVAADETFPLPQVAIAETFSVLALWGTLPPEPAHARARAAATRAVDLDPFSAEAHAWLGWVELFQDWDFAGSAHYFQQALRLPRPSWMCGFPFGIHHLAGGRWDAAGRTAHRLADEEPLSPLAQAQGAGLLVGLGRFPAAREILEAALDLDADHPMVTLWLAHVRGVEGRFREAAELLQRTLGTWFVPTMINLPALLVAAGDTDAARKVVAMLEDAAGTGYVSWFSRAMAWAALGDEARAREFLREAEGERSPLLTACLLGEGFLALAPVWMKEWFVARRQQVVPPLASPTAGGGA